MAASQFASLAFVDELKKRSIAISIDGRDQWRARSVRRAAVEEREVRGCVSEGL